MRRGRAQQVEHRDQVRDVTYETLKTKLREVLEKTQKLSKENGKDDTELRDFAAKVKKTRHNSATARGRRIPGDSAARVPSCCGDQG